MTSAQVSGTEGYADEAEELFRLYESIPAADAHRAVLHLIPAAPARVLDIGSGTGRDAAWFAGQAIAWSPSSRPTRCAFRRWRCIPRPRIEWLDDSLPDLALLRARGETVRPRDAHRGLDASR